MKSKTRSRGASIEVVSEIGPTGRRFYVPCPAPDALASTPGKYGLSVAHTKKYWPFRTTRSSIAEPPNDRDRTESRGRPALRRAGRRRRVVHLSGVLFPRQLRARRRAAGVSQLRRHRFPPRLHVRA